MYFIDRYLNKRGNGRYGGSARCVIKKENCGAEGQVIEQKIEIAVAIV